MILYGLVLLAAVVGLLVDRLHFSPAAVRGESVLQAVQALIPTMQQPESQEGAGPAIAPLFKTTDQQHSTLGDGPVRNAFAPLAAIQEQSDRRPGRRGERTKADGGESETTTDADGFRAAHQLQATSLQKKGSWALIDDRVFRKGDKLDGFVLRQIDHYRVTFEADGVSVDLALPPPLDTKVPASQPR